MKAPLSTIFEFLEEKGQENQSYLNDLKKMSAMGLLPIMVARKVLTTDETYELKTRIDEAMSLMKHQDEKII